MVTPAVNGLYRLVMEHLMIATRSTACTACGATRNQHGENHLIFHHQDLFEQIMAGVYIPPHVRKATVKAARVDDEAATATVTVTVAKPKTPHAHDDGRYSLRELHGYFWPGQEVGSSTTCKTLHDTAAAPGVMGYMLLFHGANPRWHHDRIIFVKSNLDLLPAEIADERESQQLTAPEPVLASAAIPENVVVPPAADGVDSSSSSRSGTGSKSTGAGTNDNGQKQPQPAVESDTTHSPIAVFIQTQSFSSTSSALNDRSFVFDGWYRVSRLAFLQPRSDDLVRMLDQKFSIADGSSETTIERVRTRDTWESCFNKRWAVVKLEKCDEPSKQAPKIARVEGGETAGGGGDGRVPGTEAKTVNELLRELRMQNAKNAMA